MIDGTLIERTDRDFLSCPVTMAMHGLIDIGSISRQFDHLYICILSVHYIYALYQRHKTSYSFYLRNIAFVWYYVTHKVTLTQGAMV